MRLRNVLFGVLASGFVLAAAAPAFADGDDWRWRRQEWREHEWREHHGWRPYYAPPVVVAPPPSYAPPPVYYAPPPPAYYPSPGVSFGFTVR